MYEKKKRKEREEQENLAVPSSAGSVDQEEPFRKFPVDSITGPTRCKLFVPVAKGAFKIEITSGMVYPELLWHGKLVPTRTLGSQLIWYMQTPWTASWTS